MSPAEAAAFSVTDKRVLATAQALKNKFKAEYAINGRPGEPGVAIGRYPEDNYFGGNPWALLTAAFAQLDYMAGSAYLRQDSISIEAQDLTCFRDLLPDAADKSALRGGMTLEKGSRFTARSLWASARSCLKDRRSRRISPSSSAGRAPAR